MDGALEAQTLNPIARKASTAQGMAFMTIYERSFSMEGGGEGEGEGEGKVAGSWEKELVDELRGRVRLGEMQGHLSIGFAVVAGLLGLSLGSFYVLSFVSACTEAHSSLFPPSLEPESTQHLFLFLHARSILSSSVRLNTVGPYVSHRLLLHDVKPLVTAALEACHHLRVEAVGPEEEASWWDEDGPASTWPLGDILIARHGQLFSKIFNS